MSAEPVLEVRHLNSYYQQGRTLFGQKGKHRQVLHDISFSIAQGEIVGLVGESGCGKTTLSRTILGMIHDYDGEIIHHSERPQMVFQDPYSSLNPAKTIGWILEEPLRIQGKLSAPERKAAVIRMLGGWDSARSMPPESPTSSPAVSASGSASLQRSSPAPDW